MTDYLALQADENFRSLWEEGGICRDKIAYCRRRLLETHVESEFERGRIQGTLYALEQLARAVETGAQEQAKSRLASNEEPEDETYRPQYIRSVP